MNCSRVMNLLIYLVGAAIIFYGMEYMGKSDFGPIYPVVLPLLGAYVWLGLGSYIFGRMEASSESGT